MSAWPGKYVIGLTGNIATGKSVVRKMLEHLGAYGIDADALGHRAIAQDAPGYQPVVETFGKWILAQDGQIDRARLGRVVFSDPEALARLEAIVHPLVRQAIDVLVRRSGQRVIVIEAIKLIESGLRRQCDSLWVATADPAIQLSRLMQNRGMSEAAARQRIAAQPPQREKIALADLVVHNDRSFEETWRQVSTGWSNLAPVLEGLPGLAVPARKEAVGVLTPERGSPREAAEIAAFLNKVSGGRRHLSRSDIMAAFGEKAFLLLKRDGKIVALAGWQVENLVARSNDFAFEPGLPFGEALGLMMNEIERVSHELQCEISLLFLPNELAAQEAVWQGLGYRPGKPEALAVRAWQEAAAESMQPGTTLLFKQLRKDRVLRPV